MPYWKELVALIGSFVAVSLSRPSPEPAPALAPVTAPIEAPRAVAVAPPEPCPPLPEPVDLSSLEAELAAENAAYKDEQLRTIAREGAPSPWPDEAPAAYGEAALRAQIARILSENHEGAELYSLDCDEWPCVGVLREPIPADTPYSSANLAEQVRGALPEAYDDARYSATGSNLGHTTDNWMVVTFAFWPRGLDVDDFRLQNRIRYAGEDAQADMKEAQ